MNLALSYDRGLNYPAFRKQGAYAVGVRGAGVLGTGLFSNVPDEVNQLNAEITALNTEMFNQLGDLNTPLGEFYTTAWKQFQEAWQEFADKHQHWYNNMWLSAWHDVQDFRRRFIQMRKQAEGVGYHFVSPEPTPVKEDDVSKLADFLKTLLWVAIIFGGGYLLVKFWGMAQ